MSGSRRTLSITLGSYTAGSLPEPHVTLVNQLARRAGPFFFPGTSRRVTPAFPDAPTERNTHTFQRLGPVIPLSRAVSLSRNPQPLDWLCSRLPHERGVLLFNVCQNSARLNCRAFSLDFSEPTLPRTFRIFDLDPVF